MDWEGIGYPILRYGEYTILENIFAEMYEKVPREYLIYEGDEFFDGMDNLEDAKEWVIPGYVRKDYIPGWLG